MNNRPRHIAASLLIAGAVLACATKPVPDEASDAPGRSVLAPLMRLSLELRKEPLVRHVLDGRVYYFALSPCCDMYNHLYDEQGNYVCAPNGGFTGQGDGRCQPQLRKALGQSKGEQVPNPFYKPQRPSR